MNCKHALRMWAIFCAVGSSGCALSSEDADSIVVEIEDERAFGITWEDYRSLAIRAEGGAYVAERDLLFKDEGVLRDHYEQMVLREKEKLVVFRRISDGFEPTLAGNEQVRLTYCVSNSFSNKSDVVSYLKSATRSWEAVARLRFVYLPEQDASCTASNGNVQFAVMTMSVPDFVGCAANKEYWGGLGCQQFPFNPLLKGVLLLNFGLAPNPGETWTGVVRHELGHILGFRHEHPWDSPPVCDELQTNPQLDATGRQLTPYDVQSVMHYQDCDGIAGSDSIISARDGVGARSIYGMPAAWNVPLFQR